MLCNAGVITCRDSFLLAAEGGSYPNASPPDASAYTVALIAWPKVAFPLVPCALPLINVLIIPRRTTDSGARASRLKGNKRRSRRLARRPDSFFHDWFRSQWPFSRRQLVRVIVLFRHSLHDPHCERATIETGYNECRGASSCNGGVAERPRRIRDEGTRRRIQEARYPGKESGAKEKKKKRKRRKKKKGETGTVWRKQTAQRWCRWGRWAHRRS